MSNDLYRCTVCNKHYPLISLKLDCMSRHEREGNQ